MKKLMLFVSLLSFLIYNTQAQWGPTTISTYTGAKQFNVSIESKNEGVTDGAIVAWRQSTSRTTKSLFVQKISNEGSVLWTASGVQADGNIGTVSEVNACPLIASDNAGGCIVVYSKYASGDDHTYALRVDLDGDVVWGPIDLFTGPTARPRLTATQYDKFVIAAGVSDYVILAQMIDLDGGVYWMTGNNYGHVIYVAQGYSYAMQPCVVTDGSGGAIINWLDDRNHAGVYDIYAQRVNFQGWVQWNSNAVLVFSVSTNDDDPPPGAYNHNMIYSGDGAIMTGYKYTVEFAGYDVYAAKVTLNGNVPWSVNGANISNSGKGNGFRSLIISDGGSGACIVFPDSRPINNQNNLQIYGAKIDEDAALIWSPNQVLITEDPSDLYVHYLANRNVQNGIDTFGGQILVPWININTSEIYFQPRNISDGSYNSSIFPEPSLISSNATEDYFTVSAFIDIYSTSAIIVYNVSNELFARAQWLTEPYNPGPGHDIMKKQKQHVCVAPNPFNPTTMIEYTLATNNYVTIEVYDILGRKIETLIENEYRQAGAYSVIFDAAKCASGVYFLRVNIGDRLEIKKLMLIR